MKNLIIIVLIVFAVMRTHAQNYLIGFAATGDTTVIETIKVFNLTSGDSVMLSGGDILHLKTQSGINLLGNGYSPLQISPDPVVDKSLLTFFAPGNGNTEISISEISGKTVGRISTWLSSGTCVFRISGLNRGLYVLKVTGQDFDYSAKLVSTGNAMSGAKIEYVSNENISPVNKPGQYKNLSSTIDMPYGQGDILLCKSISGQYSTILTDIPVSSKTITFQFAACRDADNNRYATLHVGTQTWMAENLNVGGMIKDTTSQGSNGILEKYCYENKESNCTIYGGLYQWGEMMNYDTVPGSKGICPAGWHIPTDAEWTTLMTYLGGDSIAGGKMKETGTRHWAPPNTGATNESGFTALPGGYRYYSGTLFLTDYATFWSSTESLSAGAWYRLLQFNYNYVVRRAYTKENGYSVRCIRN